MKSTYLKPTVLWRAVTPDGEHAKLTIVPTTYNCSLVLTVGDLPVEAVDHPDMPTCLAAAATIRHRLLSEGWTILD